MTNSGERSPVQPVFFVDRCLGTGDVPQALRSAGAMVEIHDDHFDCACDDEEWIGEVARRGWIILTKDKRIRRRAAEISTLEQAGAAAFVLTAGSINGAEMGQAFVDAMPEMISTLSNQARPFVATVTRSGKVTVRFTTSHS